MIAGSDAVYSNDFKVQKFNSFRRNFILNNKLFCIQKVLLMSLTPLLPTEVIILEEITHQFRKRLKLFLELENSGGFVENLKSGKIAEIIYQQAIAEQNWVEGKIKLIGVNLYPKLEKTKSIRTTLQCQRNKTSKMG